MNYSYAPPKTLSTLFLSPKDPFFRIIISQMHPFLNILLCQRFNNLHSLSPYDPILHLKLPLKYIEVEIDYLNLFMACTYDHLRL